MNHTITVEGIKLYGFHGCLEEEAKIGGHYVVDVYLSTNFSAAAKDDELSKTIDYCSVFEICKRQMAIRSQLIEQVCDRIHRSIRAQFTSLLGLRVKVTKLSPPMNGDVEKVSVEISD